MDSAADAALDAAGIGLRATLSSDPNDPRRAHLAARIDAGDIALARDGEQYTGHLRLAIFAYAADGRAQYPPVAPLDLHYSAAERDEALRQGIAFDRPDMLIGSDTKSLRLVVFDVDSNSIGSLTIPVGPSGSGQAH
jgi:hypothetical protein